MSAISISILYSQIIVYYLVTYCSIIYFENGSFPTCHTYIFFIYFYQNQQKTLALTKEEVMMLVEIIQAYPVLLSEATNATNNQLKEATWIKLT